MTGAPSSQPAGTEVTSQVSVKNKPRLPQVLRNLALGNWKSSISLEGPKSHSEIRPYIATSAGVENLLGGLSFTSQETDNQDFLGNHFMRELKFPLL